MPSGSISNSACLLMVGSLFLYSIHTYLVQSCKQLISWYYIHRVLQILMTGNRVIKLKNINEVLAACFHDFLKQSDTFVVEKAVIC